MSVEIKVLRALNQWVTVENLGPGPYEIRGSPNIRTRYIIGQDEDSMDVVLTTISPAKDGLGKTLSDVIKQPVFEITVESLQRGHAVPIEGILPGNTKSEMLRITKE